MLLTITTTHRPATDLGYLLHKHPDKAQTFPMSFGQVHVVYPAVSESKCTAALLLDIDPVALVRGKASGASNRGASNRGGFDQYVNDRPYVASSFLSVAIAKVFRMALSGRCKDRPALANTPIPLVVTLPALPCRSGASVLRSLFEPLGYTVSAEAIALDETFPAWGESDYVSVTLSNTMRLSELLSHLYVLIPVLDTEILSSDHYRGVVADDETDQRATKDAFEVLHYIAAKRLAAGRLTVINATSVQPEARKPLLKLAKDYHFFVVAIAPNMSEAVCHARNAQRADRQFGSHVVKNHVKALKRSLKTLKREKIRYIHILNSLEEIDAVEIERQPL